MKRSFLFFGLLFLISLFSIISLVITFGAGITGQVTRVEPAIGIFSTVILILLIVFFFILFVDFTLFSKRKKPSFNQT